MKKGIFITFEGTEGCGKTTHIDLLERYLKRKKYKVIKTREPGGTKIGRKIRDILLNSKSDEFVSYTELFLFAADRLEHIEKVIKPAIKNKKIILCDRYVDSTIAYQVGGRCLDSKIVKMINEISSVSIKPDLTILFGLDIKKGLERATKVNKDRIEKEGIEFHRRVSKKYMEIAKNENKRIKTIKVGNKSIKQISLEVIKIIDNYIKNIEKNGKFR